MNSHGKTRPQELAVDLSYHRVYDAGVASAYRLPPTAYGLRPTAYRLRPTAYRSETNGQDLAIKDPAASREPAAERMSRANAAVRR